MYFRKLRDLVLFKDLIFKIKLLIICKNCSYNDKYNYHYLAENEYFCMKAVEKAGVKIPKIQLSKNAKFLLVEKFNYSKEKDEFLGFEEMLVLLRKNREKKYSGSYEQIAKVIYSVTTHLLIFLKKLKCQYLTS
ncbi:MAG: conserved hypothetical protein [uncultured Sulfurovum sp.]|uniref:HipA-like C-terminal domain-containing protein n=1 Tax=uncultured Sulfurovum sp. TaxID=269237 RepID=A0A6S6UJB9_9BACT|nr:MAG: conserved hypothetical protein [uncultured Sulfurovum sp.]